MYQLLDFQKECIIKALNNINKYNNNTIHILINSPTGSGKTLMSSYIYKNMVSDEFGEELDSITIKEQFKGYTENIDKEKICYLWLSPGAGDLEHQSYNNFKKYLDNDNKIKDLDELITDNEFLPKNIYFINWEQFSETKNSKINKNETFLGLDALIENAHQQGLNFIVFIDEAHRNAIVNDISKINDEERTSNKWLKRFDAIVKIRVSATIKEKELAIYQAIYLEENDNVDILKSFKNGNDRVNYIKEKLNHRVFEINVEENDVVEAGLISKSAKLNNDKNLKEILNTSNEDKSLILMAIEKQKQLKQQYTECFGMEINPLILIQIPSASKEKSDNKEDKIQTQAVKDILKEIDKDYTVENGKVAVWLSEENTTSSDELKKLYSSYTFLIMKQAVATGWDCPRAKILVKLRNNMDSSFEKQTIGRVKRTIIPNSSYIENGIIKRYEDFPDIDYAYIYTNDTAFINKTNEYQAKELGYKSLKLTLKDNYKDIKLPFLQEYKDDNYISNKGSKEIAEEIKKDLYKKIGDIKHLNKEEKLKHLNTFLSMYNKNGFLLDNMVEAPTFEQMGGTDKNTYKEIIRRNLNKNSLAYKNAIKEISSKISLSVDATLRILSYLFFENNTDKINVDKNGELIALNEKEFYNFIYNTKELLYRYLRKYFSGSVSQRLSDYNCNTQKSVYEIYTEDFIKGKEVNNDNEYRKMIFNFDKENNIIFDSNIETSFANNIDYSNIEYWYKNGESNEKYFRVVYLDNLLKQHYFYPDFIVKNTSGKFYIVETKGQDNIDEDAENKFYRLKEYINELRQLGIKNVEFYFIRSYGGKFAYSNTEYDENIESECWKKIRPTELSNLFN